MISFLEAGNVKLNQEILNYSVITREHEGNMGLLHYAVCLTTYQLDYTITCLNAWNNLKGLSKK